MKKAATWELRGWVAKMVTEDQRPEPELMEEVHGAARQAASVAMVTCEEAAVAVREAAAAEEVAATAVAAKVEVAVAVQVMMTGSMVETRVEGAAPVSVEGQMVTAGALMVVKEVKEVAMVREG